MQSTNETGLKSIQKKKNWEFEYNPQIIKKV